MMNYDETNENQPGYNEFIHFCNIGMPYGSVNGLYLIAIVAKNYPTPSTLGYAWIFKKIGLHDELYQHRWEMPWVLWNFTLLSHWHALAGSVVVRYNIERARVARFHYINFERPQRPEFSTNFKKIWHTDRLYLKNHCADQP